MPSQVQTTALTTYDLVKSLAILLTVLDHVGYFFYPDNEWFRVLGRGCIPIWCFLIGYASSRDTGKDIWIWAGALLVSNLIFGGNLLPLNILFTFLFVRLVIDRIALTIFQGWEIMLYGFTGLTLLIVPTMMVTEYGTAALLLALCGYAMRHQDEMPVSKFNIQVFFFGAVTVHALSQMLFFDFEGIVAKSAAFLMGSTALMMYFFQPLQFVGWTNRAPRVLTDMLQLTGRYTLEIYVIHLVVFKGIAAYYGLQGYGFLAWRLMV